MSDRIPELPPKKAQEAASLWEVALRFIGLSIASRAVQQDIGLGNLAAGGFRASQLLARAYYRLMRAIFTGATVADRTDDVGDETNLRDLYSDFETLAYRSIPQAKHEQVRKAIKKNKGETERVLRDVFGEDHDKEDIERFESTPELRKAAEAVSKEDGGDYAADETDDDEWPDDDQIAVELLEEADRIAEEIERAEKEELAQLEKDLAQLEKDRKREERKEVRRRSGQVLSKRAEEKRRKLADAKHRGKRAARTMQAAQAGARAEIAVLSNKDKRAIGYVRMVHSANPCSICLMLASRGIMLYKSAQSALASWHPGCQCSAEPVFSRDDYFQNPRFAVNRALHMMWRDITADAYGKKKMTVWRRYFAQQTGSGLSPEERTNRPGFKTLETVVRENARDHKRPRRTE